MKFKKEYDGETLVSIGGGEGIPLDSGYALKIVVYDPPKPLKFPRNIEAELTFEDGVTLRLKTSVDMCEQYYVGRDIEFVKSDTGIVHIAKCVGFKELIC